MSKAHEKGLLVVAHPPGIFVDDVFEMGAPLFQVQELICLLLVLGHRESGLRMVEDIVHLVLNGVLKKGNGDTSQALGRHHCPVKLWPVIPDDGRLVAPLKTQRCQSQGKRSDLYQVLGIGIGLPDTEILLPDGIFLIAVFFYVFQ